MLGLQLKGFHQLCQSAMLLAPKTLFSTPEDELQKCLTALAHEEITLPPETKLNLFSRTMNKLIAERKFTELLEIAVPWEEQPWCSFSPVLGAVSNVPGRRMRLFKKLLFEKVLGVLIMKGEEQSKQVHDICMRVLKQIECVDTVLLDNVGAVTLDETSCICHGVVGVVSNTLDPVYVEPRDYIGWKTLVTQKQKKPKEVMSSISGSSCVGA